MKYLVSLLLIFAVNLIAQEASQGQNVELPDFVITGKETFTLPEMKKMKPEHISTLSEQFILPVYSPEELEIKEFSDPLKKDVLLLDEVDFANGSLFFGLSNNYLPSAKLNYYLPFENAFLNAGVNTISRRPYVENADLFSVSGNLKFDYFIDENSGFLPGVNLYGNGIVEHSSRKFFASLIPDLKREITNADVAFGLKNLSGKNFIYDFRFNDEFVNLGNENLSENVLGFTTNANLFFKNFEVIAGLQFNSQYLKHPSQLIGNQSFNYLKTKGLIGFKASRAVRVNFGFEYSSSDTNYNFSPVAELSFKLDKGILFLAEYNPTSEFVTNKALLAVNPYFNSLGFNNLFMKKNSNFLLAVKFEYKKQFEINGGFKYYNSPDHYYFTDTVSPGFFELNTTEAKSFNTFINILVHPGRFGYLYAELNAGEVKDTAGLLLPYYPSIKGEVVYGYKFDFGVLSKIKLKYLSRTYADLANTMEIDPYIDLGLNFDYSFNNGFNITLEFNNLLSRKNYLFKNYKETPVDIMAGINYTW